VLPDTKAADPAADTFNGGSPSWIRKSCSQDPAGTGGGGLADQPGPQLHSRNANASYHSESFLEESAAEDGDLLEEDPPGADGRIPSRSRMPIFLFRVSTRGRVLQDGSTRPIRSWPAEDPEAAATPAFLGWHIMLFSQTGSFGYDHFRSLRPGPPIL